MTDISQRVELLKLLKHDLMMADLMLKAAYGFEDTEAIEKAWSDEARRAAAEARRHSSIADEHRKLAAQGGSDAAQHLKAAGMHDKASMKFTHLSSYYGSSKIKTLAMGMFNPFGGVLTALPYRAFSQHVQRRGATNLGAKADKFSHSITS